MKHVFLILFAGDYREAARRRDDGLPDQYRHHSYAVASLERVVASGARVTVIQMKSPEAYDELRPDGLRLVGLGQQSDTETARAVGALLDEGAATHVMVRTPSLHVLREVVSRPVQVSVVLADSFTSRIRHRRRYRELARLLAHPCVAFVANHHLNSSRQLVRVLGLDPARVIPWDWPMDLTDLARSSAKGLPVERPLRLCYVGSISKSKGVWDLIDAVRLLRSDQVDARLEIAGAGDADHLQRLVEKHSLEDRVEHLGRLGGDAVVEMMQRSTFVCVPSRPSYPEGLPLTLFEAMASGTPIVASDHPMFTGVVREGQTGFVFRAGRPRSLVAAVLRGWKDEAMYAHVSSTAAASYPDLGLPTVWGELLERWVGGGVEDRAWLADRALGR